MPPASIYDTLSPEQIARIKMRYEAGVGTVSEIAADEGLLGYHLQNMRLKFGWASRKARTRQAVARAVEHEQAIAAAQQVVEREDQAAAAVAQPQADDEAPTRDAAGRFIGRPAEDAQTRASPKFDAVGLVRHIRILIEREVGAMQAQGVMGEAGLRSLAMLTRSLASLKSIESGKGGDRNGDTGSMDDGPPLDLAELRRDLARRLAVLREDGDAS